MRHQSRASARKGLGTALTVKGQYPCGVQGDASPVKGQHPVKIWKPALTVKDQYPCGVKENVSPVKGQYQAKLDSCTVFSL